MKKIEHPTNTNFWFGFALGSLTLTALAYLVGTKNGREKLKELLAYADTVNDLPEELFALLPTIKQMLITHNENKTDESESIKPEEQSLDKKVTQSIESLLDKVKHTAEEKKETKKYFIK